MIRSAVAFAIVTAVPALAQTSSADRLAWLAGCWEQRAAGRVVTEMWMPPAGGSMMGASRTVSATGTTAFEQLRIVARGDTLVYIALPSGQALAEFKSTLVTDASVKFENPAHDFPKIITYTRTAADSVVARVEGGSRVFSIPMRRISCTDRPAPPPRPDTMMFDAQLSRDGRRLVIVKGVANNLEIHVGNPDGSNARPITNHAAADYMPDWSPDGTRLAFVSSRDGHQEIYTIRPDGTDLMQLTRGTAHTTEPSWSPDGKQIVFRSDRDGNRPHLFIMNADGSDQRQITRDADVALDPSFSPDGKTIVFNSTQTGHNEIYVMNADGSGRRALTVTDQTGGVKHSGAPRWSPDGKYIAFFTTRDGNQEVYVMNADGTNVRNLSNHPGMDVPSGWTPDGYILFRSTRDRPTYFDFYKIKPDGTGLTRVTTTRTP